MNAKGTLYVVATPLGNLDDLSGRAVETMKSVALIAAEDTRRTGRLLMHLGIEQTMVSCHDFSNRRRMDEILETLEAGNDVALVSDAGTPLLSDPGFELVREARDRAIPVVPVPGPSALTTALSVAGLPTDRFPFCGFPPARSGARREFLQALAGERSTLVFFESSHRIQASTEAMAAVFGEDREAFIGREMTKLHEQYRRSDLQTLAAELADNTIPAKGEFVVIVSGRPGASPSDAEEQARHLMQALAGELPPSRAAKVVARLTGVPRGQCYELAPDQDAEG